MSIAEIKQAYDRLSEVEQIELATIIAADQRARSQSFRQMAVEVNRGMDEGRKYSHTDVASMSADLASRGL